MAASLLLGNHIIHLASRSGRGSSDSCVLLQVVVLQAWVRRWSAQQKVAALRWERDRRLAWMEEQVQRRREEKEEQLRERHQRWSNPQRQEDFNQLHRSVASKTRPSSQVTTVFDQVFDDLMFSRVEDGGGEASLLLPDRS